MNFSEIPRRRQQTGTQVRHMYIKVDRTRQEVAGSEKGTIENNKISGPEKKRNTHNKKKIIRTHFGISSLFTINARQSIIYRHLPNLW